MKLLSAISWLALVSSSVAYSVSNVQYSVTNGDGTVSGQSAEGLSLDSQTAKFEVAFKVQGSDQPHQLVVLLSGENGLDYAFYPKYTVNTIRAKIPVAKIPDALKMQDKIHVSIIAAGANAKTQENVVDLLPSEQLRASLKVKEIRRLGAKPEIHHQFKPDPETVGAFLPVVFSGLAVVFLVALLGLWGATLKGELFGATEGSLWKIGYLVTLTMFEFTFAKYYLGSSIFSILFQGAVLAGPLLFFGSRSLSALARARA